MSQDYHRDREETEQQTVIGWTPGEDKASAQKKREMMLRMLVYGLGGLIVCTLLSVGLAIYYFF